MARMENVEANQASRSFAYEQMQELHGEIARGVHMGELERQIVVGAVALGGAVLFEGSPSTGKTRSANVIATAIGGKLGRVQGNPDTMPADIIGPRILKHRTDEFEFEEGPIFSNVFFVDELNRMPTKTQAALLEAMQEGQVTVTGESKSRELPNPFIVLATQNPSERAQGTNPLTVAQVDRFNVGIDLPALKGSDRRAAKRVMDYQPTQVIDINDIHKMTSAIESLAAPEDVDMYADDLVDNMRELGVVDEKRSALDGLRASIQLVRYAKALAMQHGDRVIAKEHVDMVAPAVFSHRTSFNFDGLEQGYTVDQALAEAKSNL